MSNRKRPIQVKFRVTGQERERIGENMETAGTRNMAYYLRQMAVEGKILRLEVPELREIVRLLRYTSNNLNQLTKRAHETGAVYAVDIEGLHDSFEKIWDAAEQVLVSLSKL